MLSYYPILIILAPLIAALITTLPENLIGRKVYRAGALAQTVAFGVALQVLYEVAAPGHEGIHLSIFSSLWSGVLQFDLYIDRLAAVMMVLITGISTLIYLYSIRYMEQERGRARFHTLLALTTFVLLCMVSSANLLMLFLFWQLLSWLLCLLAYHYSHPPTVRGAFRTFTILRVGDVAFLSGIILAYSLYGTLDFGQLFIQAAKVQTTFSLWPGGIEIRASTVITLLIFIGAMSKSAQFPLHMWLPDSLYAPTPVHALLHAGIINAGGFLLNRLAPLYGLSTVTLHVVFGVGALTAFLGACMMLTQNDIKKTLGYSTIGQMGYMIMECGLGAFGLAVFHLIAHGLFKATIFLNCGHVIHTARQDPRLPSSKSLGNEPSEQTEFSYLIWLTGFITTLILPLVILLAAHDVLSVPLRDSQGIVIFLFFSWVTSSQAILTLYRLRAVASPKVAALMLLTLLLVVLTYLWAAESFTYFLYPTPGEVAFYFQSAALPGWLFDGMVGVTALFIILGWIFIYAKSHGQSIRMPQWINGLQVRLYLLFMNRLYLDALSHRFGQVFMRMTHRLNQSKLFPYIAGLIALGLVLPAAARIDDLPAADIVLFFVAAFTLPLFPLHGVYLFALTRLPGYLPLILAFLLPAVGMYCLSGLLYKMSAELLQGIGVLALLGALYGSLKALVQFRVTQLLAYAGLSFFSILWWYLAVTGTFTPQAAVYTVAVILVIGGLFLAWHTVQKRYGDLDLNRIGGLARPMPSFAVLMSLMVMAAVGLPPFGLFSGYMAMLLSPSFVVSWDLIVILLVWLAASWYLFRLMQRLLFGPHRSDILYEDLRFTEVTSLLIVLLILVALGIVPYGFFQSDTLMAGDPNRLVTELTNSFALEFNLWEK